MSLLTDASLLLTPNAYKSTKLYSIIPSNGNGDFTFTRATTATRVNSAGYNELLYYNLLQYSEMFADALWTKASTSITANTQTAPNETLTADTLSVGIDGSSVRHRLYQTVTNVTNLTVSGSYYLKAAQHQWIQLCGVDTVTYPSDVWANFNLSTGTIGNQGAGTTASIENVGNGWYRCTVTGTRTTLGSSTNIEVITTNNTNSGRYPTYQSSVAEDVCYVWGAQLVDGSNILTYQKTEVRLSVPRIDYSLGGCPNILVEPLRTNLCLWSEDFNNAAWSGVASVTANAFIAPDGVLSADTLTDSSTTTYQTKTQTFTITANLAYTTSVYIRKTTGALTNYPGIVATLSGGVGGRLVRVIVNTTTGTFNYEVSGSPAINSYSATLTSFNSDYWRLTLTTQDSQSNTSYQLLYYPAISLDGTTVTNTATGSATFWGAQLELGNNNGSFATSYIPTTSATVTRNSDSFTRSNIYTNGLISASGGTWFVELRNNIAIARAGGYPTIYMSSTSSGSTGNVIGFSAPLSVARLGLYYFQNSGSQQSIGTPASNTIKVAFVWTPTTLKAFVNGSLFGSYTGLTWDVTTFQNIFVKGETLLNLNEMALFPTPLSDTRCIALTT